MIPEASSFSACTVLAPLSRGAAKYTGGPGAGEDMEAWDSHPMPPQALPPCLLPLTRSWMTQLRTISTWVSDLARSQSSLPGVGPRGSSGIHMAFGGWGQGGNTHSPALDSLAQPCSTRLRISVRVNRYFQVPVLLIRETMAQVDTGSRLHDVGSHTLSNSSVPQFPPL